MKRHFSLLQKLRLSYQPSIPNQLKSLTELAPFFVEGGKSISPDLQHLFPKTAEQKLINFKKEKRNPATPLRVGAVLSGGQAPGGHNVLVGLLDALKSLHPESSLYGFLNGPSGIIKQQYIEITTESAADYRNQGGFDMIGSGRTKIETPEQFAAAQKAVETLQLDGLVVVGGDDSNTNAALLAEYFKSNGVKTVVVGVPKTIDGDLKNAWIETSFGFDSASKTYAQIIGNIEIDALSAKKYTYFIKLMGRSASHITLECALQTRPNYTIISEEIEAEKKTLRQLVKEIADVICLRSQNNKDFGVILIPEGVIEFIPECKALIAELNALLATQTSAENDLLQKLTPSSRECYETLPPLIQQQLLIDRDPHGNVQVSKIETERLFIELVSQELVHRKKMGTFKGVFSPQAHFCGYEGRSCLPSNFDCNYCYALGQTAALLVSHRASGYMACVQGLSKPVEEWQVAGVPIVEMMGMETRHGKAKPVIQKALVDLNGAVYASFCKERGAWVSNDEYLSPGPIQFFGPREVTECTTMTLALEAIT